MLDAIVDSLKKNHSPILIDELVQAYDEAKRNFYAGGHRLSAVEGGRFCEAAFRLLEERIKGSYTALGRELDTGKLTKVLASQPRGDQPDSVRIYIPRSLRTVYDIRNNRDAAHLADGIDPNLQDATLVVAVLDWVMAEFVRLYHNVSADEAHRLIGELVTKKAPLIQEFDGFLKVLKPRLRASEYALALLYHRGSRGALYDQLLEWVQPTMQKNLKRTLKGLIHDKAFVHFDGRKYLITVAGRQYVEGRGLLQPL